MYIIEDLHWQDDRIEKKDALKTRRLLSQVQGVFEIPYLSVDERNTADARIFDTLTSEGDDTTDAIAVLSKALKRRGTFGMRRASPACSSSNGTLSLKADAGCLLDARISLDSTGGASDVP
jgi:hypothetical protein